MTGLARLDRPHRDLDRCLRGLADAVRARDLSDARRQTCLLVEKLAEHFADEEEIMRATGWPLLDRHVECHELLLVQARRFERNLAGSSLTPDLASWALVRLPELIRFHCIATDFGFAKHALRVTHDPRPRLARHRDPRAPRG